MGGICFTAAYLDGVVEGKDERHKAVGGGAFQKGGQRGWGVDAGAGGPVATTDRVCAGDKYMHATYTRTQS